jgi:hypothetical protein
VRRFLLASGESTVHLSQQEIWDWICQWLEMAADDVSRCTSTEFGGQSKNSLTLMWSKFTTTRVQWHRCADLPAILTLSMCIWITAGEYCNLTLL